MTGYCSVAVQTGFRMAEDGCIPEGVLQVICLTTVGSPAVDTALTASITYGTAGSEGKWTMYHTFEGKSYNSRQNFATPFGVKLPCWPSNHIMHKNSLTIITPAGYM